LKEGGFVVKKGYWVSDSRFTASLKAKFILSFIIIILIMSVISITTYVTMTFYMSKLNDMFKITLQANEITGFSKTALDSTSKYIMDRKEDDKKKISSNLDYISSRISSLKSSVTDQEGKSLLELVSRQTTFFNAEIENIIKNADAKKISDAVSSKESAAKVQGFLGNNVDEFIVIELKVNKDLNDDINARTKATGIVIIVAIAIIGAVSILFAIMFSSSIAGTISKLAKYAQSIADGDLKLNKIEVKSKDDLSVLGNSFNKMGENLCNLIGKITESSYNVAHSADMLKANAEQSSKAIEQV
jgi:Methyl-accepting chemotaxis protein